VLKSLYRTCALLITAASIVSCDSPQKRALRELAKAGIEPSGRALTDAVIHQDSLRVGWLLDVGVYTEQRDPLGRTPVRIAIENQDIPTTFKLLDAKCNVNPASPDRVSILGIAVERGETAIAERLLAAGAKTDGLMPDGDQILPWSIRKGRLTFVRAMMKSGADPHLKDRMGNPLLHVAMESGRRELFDSLIELGADPGATNSSGETTLDLAFRRGWTDSIPKLAAAGADPNATDAAGLTLLDHAVANNLRDRITLLLKIGADPNHRPLAGGQPTTLERVLLEGNFELFQMFLDRDIKPPGGNWDEWLIKALHRKDYKAARLLLSQGARAATPGPDGLLPIESAALAQKGSVVKLLADYGNPAGNALYHAIARGDRDMASLLLTYGQPVNVTHFPTRETLLSQAIRKKQDRLATLLIKNGANTNLLVPEGQPTLHFAIANRCQLSVKALLDAGADPNSPFVLPVSDEFIRIIPPGAMRSVMRYDRNFTPLMLAVDSGCIQTTRHLIKAGAKRNVWTRSYSLWPINFASRRGDIRMMRLILGRDPLREERHIEVRLSEQKATLFDSAGNELFTTKVSTGRRGFATPTGEFVITDKNRDWTSTIYHASMPYFQRLSCSDFGLHQGNVPGYPASHGCIRVPPGNAAKLFSMTETGDRVIITP
jgi:ankyrin repeat protein